MKLFLIIIIFISINLSASEIDPELLSKANTEYTNGNYPGAIDIYTQILKINNSLGKVHFNLGNALFRTNQLGKSIFHYKIAKEHYPRNTEINFNIKYAREKTTDKIEEMNSWWEMNIPLTKSEILFLILVTSFFFWIPQIILSFKRSYYLGWIRNISLCFTLFFTLCLIANISNTRDFGVVTSDEAGIYSTTAKDKIKLFTLHQGAEFIVEQVLDNKWARIVLSDGKKGWISLDHTIIEQ